MIINTAVSVETMPEVPVLEKSGIKIGAEIISDEKMKLAFEKFSPCKYEHKIFRGVNFIDVDNYLAFLLNNYQICDIVLPDLRPQFTSIDELAAKGYTGCGGVNRSILLEIRTPVGAKLVKPLSALQEVIIPPCAELKLVSKEVIKESEKDAGYTKMIMEHVLPESKSTALNEH